MILADKIMQLRKKNGWSQEELAEMLGVSRQSVSKWEGAQSMPDLNKIIAMAEVFGVTTDYLVKEELETEEYRESAAPDHGTDQRGESVRWISLEEANSYLEVNRSAADRISVGVLMCILSVIPVILLACAQSAGYLSVTEDQAGITGSILLFLIIGGAVALFVVSGTRLSNYEYLEKEYTETEYGVSGMVRERKNAYEAQHGRALALGVVLCVVSVLPVLLCALLNENDDFVMGIGASVFLAIVSVGVWMIVRTCIIWGGYQKLLEEGDYTREKKAKSGDGIMIIYWCVVTAAYLGYSLYTFRWDRSWIIWPVAAVLAGAVGEFRRGGRE